MPRRSTRRDFMMQAGALAAAGAMPAFGQQRGTGPARRPNVLFLFPDQHRPDWVQGTPGIPVPTPNLSRLAARATRFDNTLAAAPVCAPSRACLASGREYDQCGVTNNGFDYPREQYTFYRALRDSGYHTMTCGKIDLSTSELELGLTGQKHLDAWGFVDGMYSPGKGRGFRAYLKDPQGAKDAYYAYLEKQDKALARRVAEDYARRFGVTPEQAGASRAEQQAEGGDSGRKDQQWIDTDASPANDEQYVDNWIARTGLDLIERAPKDQPWLLYVNYGGPHPPMDITASMERRYRGPDRVIDGFPQPHDYKGDVTPEHHQRIRQNYAAMIENIDRWTGAYLDTLERRGELDNTIIVYSSDHGEMLGDHGRWGKSVPFHPSANVPLYVAGPGVRRGHRSDALVSLMDVAATFLDYGGVERPPEMQSRSLRPVLEGKTERHRDYVLAGLHTWRLAWDGRYKYVTGFGKGGEDLVFDLASDPLEDRNLAASPPQAALRMREVLREQKARASASA